MDEHRLEQILNLENMIQYFFRQFRNELNRILGDTLTGTEYSVLSQLTHKNPQIVTELSKEFHVSVSHITHVADQLENKGLASRKRSLLDRRVVEIHITQEGSRLAEQVSRKKREYVMKKFMNLSTEEVNTLIRLFDKIV